jgi:hypothetical protein
MLHIKNIAPLFLLASLALDACATEPSPAATSRRDLDTYLQTVSPSPLDALPPASKQRFLDGVVFTAQGLDHLDYAELEVLNRTQIYDILSLFGVEYATGEVTDAAAHQGERATGEEKPPTLIP